MSAPADVIPLTSAASLMAAASQHDMLTRAVAGLVHHWATARFGPRLTGEQKNQHGVPRTMLALAVTAYVLRVEMELPVNDVARLVGRSRRRAQELVSKVEDFRENDQALNHWLNEVRDAVQGFLADE